MQTNNFVQHLTRMVTWGWVSSDGIQSLEARKKEDEHRYKNNNSKYKGLDNSFGAGPKTPTVRINKNEKDDIIRKTENQPLSESEVDLKNCLKQRLVQMLGEEQTRWYQTVKTTNLLKGDCNTRYFQLVASGKHRRTRIFRLDQEERIIEGDNNLKCYMTNYYKGLLVHRRTMASHCKNQRQRTFLKSRGRRILSLPRHSWRRKLRKQSFKWSITKLRV